MKQTKAQLQEANENLNKIIRQQGKQLKELREDYDLAARRLDGLIQIDFTLSQELKKITDMIGKNKSTRPKDWGISLVEVFLGAAVSAHIVYIFVLIALTWFIKLHITN